MSNQMGVETILYMLVQESVLNHNSFKKAEHTHRLSIENFIQRACCCCQRSTKNSRKNGLWILSIKPDKDENIEKQTRGRYQKGWLNLYYVTFKMNVLEGLE